MPSHTVRRSPSLTASTLVTLGEITTNSSPASRARKSVPRSARRIRAAVARNAESPTAWPIDHQSPEMIRVDKQQSQRMMSVALARSMAFSQPRFE